MPYSFAMNSVPVIRATGDPYLKTETASGIVSPAVSAGSSILRAESRRAGSDASDERVLMATAWAGAQARTNRPSGTRPHSATSR